MTITTDIHVGDIGTLFLATMNATETGTILDISSATVLQLIFGRPDGTVFVKPATFFTNGIDGKMGYVSLAGDLNASGTWSLQGFVTLPNGSWHSDIQKFKVFANLN